MKVSCCNLWDQLSSVVDITLPIQLSGTLKECICRRQARPPAEGRSSEALLNQQAAKSLDAGSVSVQGSAGCGVATDVVP